MYTPPHNPNTKFTGYQSLRKSISNGRKTCYTTYPDNGDTPEHRVSYQDDEYCKTMNQLEYFIDEIKNELGPPSKMIADGGNFDAEERTYTYWQKRCIVKLCCCNVWTYTVERTIRNIQQNSPMRLVQSPSAYR